MFTDWKSIVPWLLSTVTIAIGIWQYADKQAQANREPFLRKQLELVFEASATVSMLATTADEAEWRKAQARFWVLYWGPLGIVENQAVVNCMKKTGLAVGAPGSPTPLLPLSALQGVSLALATAARELVLESWQVDMPPLETVGDSTLCAGEAGGDGKSSH